MARPYKAVKASRVIRVAASRCVAVLALLAVTLLVAPGPASAQYGGVGSDLFVSPRIPLGQTINGCGTGCAAGASVDITIDGVPGVLTTVTANGSGTYSIVGLPLPDGLMAGEDYTVRATCGTVVSASLITLLCYDGNLPVGGSCEDGSDGTVGGTPPTTTTVPPIPPDGGDTGGGDLAVTGLSYGRFLFPAAASLISGGWFLIVVARRRSEPTYA